MNEHFYGKVESCQRFESTMRLPSNGLPRIRMQSKPFRSVRRADCLPAIQGSIGAKK